MSITEGRLPLFEVRGDLGDSTVEAIYEGTDESWPGHILQVTLLTYKEGFMDIHRQIGSQYSTHIEEAEKVLESKGLMIDPNDEGALGSTGMYRRIIKK